MVSSVADPGICDRVGADFQHFFLRNLGAAGDFYAIFRTDVASEYRVMYMDRF